MRLRQTQAPREKNNFWMMQTLVAVLAGAVLLLTGSELIGLSGTTAIIMTAVGIYLCLMYGLGNPVPGCQHR